MIARTVDGQVSKRSARSSLNLYVRALEQEEYGLEGVPVDFANIWRRRLAVSPR